MTALCCLVAHGQTEQPSVAQLFEQERWTDVVRRLEKSPRHSADLDYYYGVALAHLERWDEGRKSLMDGYHLAPRDKRFPIELAGIAFKQKRNQEAKHYLRRARSIDPKDVYANEFLATLYFLEGNIEAALKYWNRTGKPAIAEVRTEPPLRIRPALLDRAFAFAPASTLTLDELRASDARTRTLDVFSSYRFELAARPDGKFDVIFHAQEQNGFGNTTMEALFRTFGGIIFQEITPEYDNLHGLAINLTSKFRWDPDKRRVQAGISGPLAGDPRWHFRLGADLRNENWTIQTSFTGPSTVLGALNMRREAVAAEISRLAGSRWGWLVALEVSHRDFRNVVNQGGLTSPLLSEGYQLKQSAHLDYQLWRSAERRVNVSGRLISEAGRIWSEPGQSFEKLQAQVETRWFPQARGDNYEIQWRLRAAKTFGEIPFDELFMLAGERDNRLWMRGHVGTRHGQKGSAPLGRNYFLSNWESDRHVYSKGYLTVKLGPFLDAGKITDTSTLLGSHKWLFDTGAQAKVRIFGVGVVLLYGKDVRSGNNTFFATVAR